MYFLPPKVRHTAVTSFAQKQKNLGSLLLGAYSAECIDGDTQESGDVFQLYPVDESGVAAVELFVPFFGRKLKPFHEGVAQFFVYVLMQHPSPIGDVDVGLVKLVQLVNGNGVDFAVRQGFHAFFGWLVVVQRVHAERDVAFQAEPGGGVLPVVVEYGARHALLNEIDQPVCHPRLHDAGVFGVMPLLHVCQQCLKCLVGYGIDLSDFMDDIFHDSVSSFLRII